MIQDDTKRVFGQSFKASKNSARVLLVKSAIFAKNTEIEPFLVNAKI